MADKFQLKAVLSANDKASFVIKQATLNIQKSINSVTKNVAGKVAFLGGLGSLFSFAGIKSALTSFSDFGEQLVNTARKTGMSVEQLQRMNYVAEQSGVAVESMSGSMSKLNLNIGKAAAGKNKELAGLFKRLGISMRDANGQIRSGMDILPELADAFRRNENPAIRARMGMALFGKQWGDILPMLLEGSDGIQSSIDRLDQLKGVITEDQARIAKELGDRFRDLGIVTRGFGATIGVALSPVLTPLIKDLIKWINANRGLIATQVTKFVKGFADVIKAIDFQAIASAAGAVADAIGWLSDMLGGGEVAFGLLMVAMNQCRIASFFAMLGFNAASGGLWGMVTAAYAAMNAALLSMIRIAVVSVATAGPIGALGAAWGWFTAMVAGNGGIISGAIAMVRTAFVSLGTAMMANPLGVSSSGSPDGVMSPSRKQTLENTDALYGLTRQTLIAQAVAASSYVGEDADIPAIPTAIVDPQTDEALSGSRISFDDMVRQCNELLDAISREMLTAPDSVYSALVVARQSVWRDMTARAKSHDRMITIRPPDVVPALVLAYDLYEDAGREAEIIATNAIRHPAFLPVVDTRVLAE